jgi:hypothetical protein
MQVVGLQGLVWGCSAGCHAHVLEPKLLLDAVPVICSNQSICRAT